MRQKLVAGNWKMNGTASALTELGNLAYSCKSAKSEVLICPPSTLIYRASNVCVDSKVEIGAQDCHSATYGAHTGDLSAEMLHDAGATAVILGHSERRADHAETDKLVRAKATTAIAAGLTAIICVGETLVEREAGRTMDVVRAQLEGSLPDDSSGSKVVVAYEPVWAIGTGKVPTVEQIAEVHSGLRASLVKRFGGETAKAIRLLYGGSVKSSNAKEIFAVAEVDGALVGGASLKAADFAPIVSALDASA
ncbi:triose-phosphate isomerase [Phaeobacter sp. C3_T13_0]|uniref:triose-phosphate isomerase n=1 Tax=Phaeobacter cretensis TaxID=3342641 RepID=UPI0039BC37DC